MTFDDESLLSAFLDGELDAGRRNEVEAALPGSPRLSRRLGELGSARDLVAGLDRPPARDDVSARVLVRIAAGRPALLNFPAIRRPSPFAAAAVLGAAAGVLLAVSFVIGPRPPRDFDGAAARGNPASAPQLTDAGRFAGANGPESDPPRPDVDTAGSGRADAPPVGPPVPSRAGAGTARRPSDWEIVNFLFPGAAGRPRGEAMDEYRRMFATHRPVRRLVVDVEDLPAKVGDVEQIIKTTWPMEATPSTVRVAGGAVIDPDRGSSVYLFAVVMTREQRTRLAARLDNAFGGVREDRPPPDVLAMVTDPGRVRFSEGPRVAPLSPVVPGGAGRRIDAIKSPHDPAVEDPARRPTPHGSEMTDPIARPDGPATSPESGEAGSVTVIVWLRSRTTIEVP